MSVFIFSHFNKSADRHKILHTTYFLWVQRRTQDNFYLEKGTVSERIEK